MSIDATPGYLLVFRKGVFDGVADAAAPPAEAAHGGAAVEGDGTEAKTVSSSWLISVCCSGQEEIEFIRGPLNWSVVLSGSICARETSCLMVIAVVVVVVVVSVECCTLSS